MPMHERRVTSRLPPREVGAPKAKSKSLFGSRRMLGLFPAAVFGGSVCVIGYSMLFGKKKDGATLPNYNKNRDAMNSRGGYKSYHAANYTRLDLQELSKYIIRPGPARGKTPTASSHLVCDYILRLTDGTIVETKENHKFTLKPYYDPGLPVKGIIMAAETMTEGERSITYIPSEFGYQDAGCPHKGIPPGADLIAEINLMKISGAWSGGNTYDLRHNKEVARKKAQMPML